jgi:aspartate aminotransferase
MTIPLKVNKRVKQLVGSSTLAITAKAKEMKSQGIDVVSFAAGEPDFDTPDHIKAAGINAINKGMTRYTPSVGTLELREAICEKFQNDNKLSYKPSQVAVSCGAKHSIFNLIQVLADEGDEVILPAPYWVSYPEMIKLSGAKAVIVPTTAETQFKITPEQLEKTITPNTRLIILTSPSNPTGMLYTKKELEPIADICVKNNIYVISDEIYEKFNFTPEPYVSIASLGKDIFDLTLTVNGVSKSSAMTGWRIGYAAGSSEIIDYVKKYQDHTTSNPTSISQAAAVEALKESNEFFEKTCSEFKRRRDIMAGGFDSVKDFVSYSLPQGAFYLFCDFSKVGESDQIAKQILEEAHVAVIPGEGFGAPGFLRMSFATSVSQIEEGTRRICDWIKSRVK